MIEVSLQVKSHSHGETDQKDAWYSVTLKGVTLKDAGRLVEVSEFKLTLKSEKESIFSSYPIGKAVSLKLHDPQRKIDEG